MFGFIIRRILMIVPTLFVVSIIVFGLQKILPGDPAIALAGDNMDPDVIAEIRRANHLNDPIIVQVRAVDLRCAPRRSRRITAE